MKSAKSKKDKLVLDTSLFVNPDIRNGFGTTPTDAINGFVELADRIPSLEFYMPASIFDELMNFVDKKDLSGRFVALINQKSPSKHELTCPAYLFYELVDDMRNRINKGLRIAEKTVREAGEGNERELIQGMRKSYREALREGILDSKEDVDLIFLAKELDAMLVTVDYGAIAWADKLGVRWLMPEKFKEYLVSFIDEKEK